MPIPQLIVYTHPQVNEDEAQIVTLLNEHKLPALVDSIHKHDYAHFKKMFTGIPHRFYTIESSLVSFEVDDLHPDMQFTPHFVLYYKQQEKINVHDWYIIRRYLEAILLPSLPKPKLSSRRTSELFNLPEQPEPTLVSTRDYGAEMEIDVPDAYAFENELIPELDIMLCAIQKPHVDRAFTVVIRDYSKRGFAPLFTSLFISSAWGVCRYDVPFLSQLWRHLNMEGTFDLEKMLKEATERCYPAQGHVPEPEPEVYRKNIADVKDHLAKTKPYIQSRE